MSALPEDALKQQQERDVLRGVNFLKCLVFALSLSGICLARAQSVQITANIQINLERQGKWEAQESVLSCVISSNRWRIWECMPNGTWRKLLFNGTNLLFKSETSQSKYQRCAFDGVPMIDLPTTIGWLAFCSSSYLNNPGRLLPLPFDYSHGSVDHFAYCNKTERFDDPLNLPRFVELYF